LKKPTELDITVLGTLGLDMSTKMLALAVEATEAKQREFIMAFDRAASAAIAWSCVSRARPPDFRQRLDALGWTRGSDPGGRARNAFGEPERSASTAIQAVTAGLNT
jgi:hypothetical protein